MRKGQVLAPAAFGSYICKTVSEKLRFFLLLLQPPTGPYTDVIIVTVS